MRCFLLLLFATFYLLPSESVAQEHPCAVGEAVQGRVAEGNALKFRLEGDERYFSLRHLIIRNPDHLHHLFKMGSTISLYGIAPKPDRYRRHSAQVFVEGAWTQGFALETGAALFSGKAKRSQCVGAMEQAERLGMKTGAGVWKEGLSVLDATKPASVLKRKGKMAIVEGVIESVGDRTSRAYLNFGQKWSEDMTGQVRRKGRSRYQGVWQELLALKGKRIRLRGVIEESGGPMIRILHEAQISIVD